jgi:hypothetical protein
MLRVGRSVRGKEGVAAALIAAASLGTFRFALRIPSAITEAMLLLAILAVPLASPALIAIIRRTPIVQRAVFGGIAAAMLIGHFYRNIYDTFPFVEWDIYAYAPAGDIRLFDYYAVRRDATEEHVVPADLFPPLRKKLAVHLEQLATAIEAAADTTPRDTLMRQYDGLLRAMARAYNREHADNPLIAIRIEQWTVPVEHYAGRQSIARQPFRVWRDGGETE